MKNDMKTFVSESAYKKQTKKWQQERDQYQFDLNVDGYFFKVKGGATISIG